MRAMTGYVSKGSIVADDMVSPALDGKEVIITILDSFRWPAEREVHRQAYTADDIKEAFGLWKDHEDSAAVADYVRTIRKGRHFDF